MSKHQMGRSCTLSQFPRKEKRREPRRRRRRRDPQRRRLTFREHRRRAQLQPAQDPTHREDQGDPIHREDQREVHSSGMEATTTLHMEKVTAMLDFVVSEMLGKILAASKVVSHLTESPQRKRLTVLFTAN